MTRIVVVGSNGFIGSALVAELRRMSKQVIALSRQEVDLLAFDAESKLQNYLNSGDILVFAAAEAPCKTHTQFVNNIRMIAPLLTVAEKTSLSKIVYLSSDAVYADSRDPLDETSKVEPLSLHGVMHQTRESLVRLLPLPSLILRPTLVFGANDPHNGYGPNRFIREALAGRDITLFGNGEELRDHIHISDVAEYASLGILNHEGVLNLASGSVRSFLQLATVAQLLARRGGAVRRSERVGPMPHGGYRAFNVALLRDVLKMRAAITAERAMRQDIENYGN